MANVTIVFPDPREAVMQAQEFADIGATLVSITLDFTYPGVKGTVVYTPRGQNVTPTPALRAANRAILDAAAALLDGAHAGGADSK